MIHARRVIGTVDQAVDLLENNDMDTLLPELRSLGSKHIKYGVQNEHFPIVGEGLLDALAKALGDEFTPEVKDAWTGVYGIISDNMSAGMKDAMEEDS